VSVVEDACA